MKKIIILICMTFIMNKPFVFSQEEADNEYAYGTVVNITDTDIVLKEYNYQKEEFVEVSYKLASDVKVRNVESLKAVLPGNQVEILFSEKDGIKNALIIVLEKNEGLTEGASESIPEENTDSDETLSPQNPAPSEAAANT